MRSRALFSALGSALFDRSSSMKLARSPTFAGLSAATCNGVHAFCAGD